MACPRRLSENSRAILNLSSPAPAVPWLQNSSVLCKGIFISFFNSASVRVFSHEIKCCPAGDLTQSCPRSSEGWPKGEDPWSATRERPPEGPRDVTRRTARPALLPPECSSFSYPHTSQRSRLDYINTFANKEPFFFFLQHGVKNSCST